MSRQLLISNIMHGAWLMEPSYAEQFVPLVARIIEGTIEPQYKPATIDMRTATGETIRHAESLDSARPGTVAIVSLSGAMLREGDFCMSGTEELAEFVMAAANNANIAGILMRINSGGGAADSVAPLADAIAYAKTRKPVVAHGPMMASAAYWVGSACSELYLDSDIATVGSIGVMIQIADMKERYEREGIKLHTINATLSADKNLVFEQAKAGNYKPIQTELLDKMAASFIAAVKTNRPGTAGHEKVFHGSLVLAAEAVAMGMADGVCSLDAALARVRQITVVSSGTATASADGRPSFSSEPTTPPQTANPNPVDMKKYPMLLAMLGISELVLQDGQTHLSAEQLEQLRADAQSRFGATLRVVGASTDEDGDYNLNEAALESLENQLVTAAATHTPTPQADPATAAELARLKAENDALRNKPEPAPKLDGKRNVIMVGGAGAGAVSAAVKAFTESDRPWNEIARKIKAGDTQGADAMIAHLETDANLRLLISDVDAFRGIGPKVGMDSAINIEKMNSELGLHQQVDPTPKPREESDYALRRVTSLFPAFSTGVENTYSQISMYASEFLQPRNAEWSNKGGFTFDAETITVDEWQVSHTFTAADIWKFTRSWLNSLVNGDNPYQLPLVAFLTRAMLTHINNVERPRVFVKGVYLSPESGKAGKSINSMSGVIRSIQERIAQHRVLPTYVGVGDHAIYTDSGEVNPNHFYRKVEAVYKSIPQEMRDAFSFVAYVNRDDEKAYREYILKGLANDPNYLKQESFYTEENFRLESVPFWPAGLIVMTIPGNFVRVYRSKGDDNRIITERSKRDTVVFMDGAGKVSPIYSGQRYSSLAELEAAERTTQAIFTNAEFGAYTPIDMAADDTTPSVATHNVLRTVANTTSTAITKFDDAVAGQLIYVIGGSSTNASTIAAGGNFVGVPAGGITLSEGTKLKFMVDSTGLKFILLAQWDAQNEGSIEFAADDATPSVAGGYKFTTSAANTDGNAAITNLDDAEVGVVYTIVGGGGTYPSTIAKSGFFQYINAAYTATAGATIKLMKRPDGNFVQIS